MKKLTMFFFLMAILLNGYAQQQAFFYTEFQPDWCLESKQYQPEDSIKLDFDNDGIFDFAVTMFYHRYIRVRQIPLNGWEYRTVIPNNEEDSLVSSAPHGWVSYPDNGKATIMYGARKVVNDSTVYYAWFNEVFIDSTIYGTNPRIKEYICVHDMAYCTIPNYPLRWGQTSLDSSIGENGNSFLMTTPNPTTGLVTIVGGDLRQVETYNVLGQKVSSMTAVNNTMTLDLTGQPAGIYLVSVTDKEGRRCVRKVVKQ